MVPAHSGPPRLGVMGPQGTMGSQGTQSREAPHHRVIVVGGGQAGLATARYLVRAGIDVLVLDDQPGPGGAWRHTWPSMTLFSTSGFSNLPGLPMPPHPGFPPASHVISYLATYEEHHSIPVARPVHVTHVGHDRGRRRFTVRARDGAADGGGSTGGRERTWTADHVVAATGTWSAPFVPHVPGKFGGRQWHSAIYPGPDPFRGSRVAVVGAANSAAQIAAELTRVADVTWFTRHEPRWMPDDVDGRVLFHRNRERMLALLRGDDDPGADSRLGDIVMLPEVLAARDEGRLTATPMFSSLDELDDPGGPAGGADHLIWCTGFRPALGPVRGLLDGRVPAVPGLHLVGYGDWTGPGSATITGVGPHAKAAARAIAAGYGLEIR